LEEKIIEVDEEAMLLQLLEINQLPPFSLELGIHIRPNGGEEDILSIF
jgi:hypothetical protein